MTIVAVVVASIGWAGVLGLLIARRNRAERLVRTCHEVRGPLTAAQLVLHASARRGELAPRRVAALELELRRAALALDELVEGALESQPEVDLEDILRLQAQTWSDVADVHGASVALRLDSGGSVVKADGLRVAQAVGNVVANAIEHGGGEIEIRTRAVERGLRVEVTDGGPGLPAPVAELVGGSRRRRGGRGRGLAIASRALERQGSSLLTLPSARGACLAFELPGRPDDEPVGVM
jgi:signal transduction histidine kinase